MHKVQITSKDGKTHLILDGMDVSKNCLSFKISQMDTDYPVLHLVLMCDEVEAETGTMTFYPRMKKGPHPRFQMRSRDQGMN